MLFSFVIPTYNRSYKVIRAINSVINQPEYAKHAEIIVIDDGSTDDTSPQLNQYFKKNEIKLIKHPYNKGVALAKNTGIINAEGDYVVLLDSDDLLEKNGLSRLINLVSNHTEDLFFCGTRVLSDQKLMFDPDFYGPKSYYDLLINSVGEYLPVCRTQMMKNNLLRNLRGYESVTWLSLAKKGYLLYFDNLPIRLYDNNGEDRISNRFNGVRNSVQMKDGYALYLKEFGFDLKYLNYTEYLKINFKLLCYHVMSFFSYERS
jgi:glycosyltransferase involved in cell wall biosynthesis